MNVAIKWGLIHRNPATLVNLPRQEKREMKVFTPEQAKRFLDYIKDHRLEALFWVALTRGLRRGEILALKWSDVDLDAGKLRVNQALQRVNGETLTCGTEDGEVAPRITAAFAARCGSTHTPQPPA